MRRKRTAMNSYRPRNLLSMITVGIIVLMLIIVLHVSSLRLSEKKAQYNKKEAYLIEQIEAQHKRAENIKEYGDYTHTKQYIEDIAKERLGLVYKDEIIFEADN